MDELAQLDRMLNFIIENEPTDGEINRHTFGIEITPDVMEIPNSILCDKLKKDGYIDRVYVSETMRTYNNATFEGIVYAKQGGYSGQYLRENADKIQAKIQAQQARSISLITLLLTVILSIGTSIAAWYYSQQIWLFYHPAIVQTTTPPPAVPAPVHNAATH